MHTSAGITAWDFSAARVYFEQKPVAGNSFYHTTAICSVQAVGKYGEVLMLTGRMNNMAVLGSSEERVRLLRAGFSSKEIEMLYVILNSVKVIGVNW